MIISFLAESLEQDSVIISFLAESLEQDSAFLLNPTAESPAGDSAKKYLTCFLGRVPGTGLGDLFTPFLAESLEQDSDFLLNPTAESPGETRLGKKINVLHLLMPTKTAIEDRNGIYFITFTCHGWLPLIQQSHSYDLIYNWFDLLKENGHYLVGYVIMPNHLHALIAFINAQQRINTIIGNGKRFLAYGIKKRLSTNGHEQLLDRLAKGVYPSDQKRNKRHAVWENSFDWKLCESREFLEQKLDYIHLNPCSGKWELAEDPVEYPHSSACFYESEKQGFYPVTHYMELDGPEFDLFG